LRTVDSRGSVAKEKENVEKVVSLDHDELGSKVTIRLLPHRLLFARICCVLIFACLQLLELANTPTEAATSGFAQDNVSEGSLPTQHTAAGHQGPANRGPEDLALEAPAKAITEDGACGNAQNTAGAASACQTEVIAAIGRGADERENAHADASFGREVIDQAHREEKERAQEEREEKMQFLRSSHSFSTSPAPKKKRDPLSEPPSARCPSLVTPSLDAYVSDKERDDIFKNMARGLLEYIGCHPLARKVPISPKDADGRDDQFKSKEERERETRLKAKAAAANKKQDKQQQVKNKQKPPPPKNEKTSLDFEYAIKRWLERSWKANLPLTNAYQIGEAMEADTLHLSKGQEPILESKLDTVWNGYGFEVKSVPLADVSERDWKDLARRLRDQHLIGDKFFPSEEYHPQVGLDAMRVLETSEDARPAKQILHKGSCPASAEVAEHQNVIEREAVFWSREAHCWEDSTHVGLSADFAASTQLIRWDFDDAGPIVCPSKCAVVATVEGDDEKSRPSTSQTLSQFVETSKKEWLNMLQKGAGRGIARTGTGNHNQASDSEAANMQRSTSEPITSQPKKLKGTVPQNPGAKKRRELSDEKRQKQIEEEKEFQRFIKLHTGRTRVSQRKMEECKEPFRLYKLQQKRIAAVGLYGGVLDEMECEFEDMLAENTQAEDDEDSFVSDEKKQQQALLDQLFPPKADGNREEKENDPVAILGLNFIPKPKEKVKEKPAPMPVAERLRVGSSMMTDVEKSFAQRRMTVGKSEAANMLYTNVNTLVDDQLEREAEISFDEFLRRPMKVNLARDPGLVKSLRLYSAMVGETGLHEFDSDKVRSVEVRNFSRLGANKRPTKLPGLRSSSGNVSQSALQHMGSSGVVRSKSSLDHRSFSDSTQISPLEPLGASLYLFAFCYPYCECLPPPVLLEAGCKAGRE